MIQERSAASAARYGCRGGGSVLTMRASSRAGLAELTGPVEDHLLGAALDLVALS